MGMYEGERGVGGVGVSCEKVILALHPSVPVMLCTDAN